MGAQSLQQSRSRWSGRHRHGSGAGSGRSHALALARHGAAVIVNDKGGDLHGEGQDATPAQQVVREIEQFGGRAAVSGHDVSDWVRQPSS